jgi:hypothetical protein
VPVDLAPQIGRDGSDVLFTRREDGCPLRASVWLSDLYGHDLHRLVAPTWLLGDVSWINDGNVSVTQTLRKRTVVISRSGRIVKTMPLLNPVWAPNGQQAAYTQDSQIRVWPGGTTIGTGDNLSAPDWSPSGDEVVYSRVAGGAGRAELVVAQTDGSGERVVFRSSRIGQPFWSPDGAAIVVPAGTPLYVEVVTPDGTTATNVTPSLKSVGGLPAWGTYGWLAFTGRRGGGWGLYVAHADGSRLRRLTGAVAAPDRPLSWYAENTGVAFEGSTASCRRVGIFRADLHGRTYRLTNGCR